MIPLLLFTGCALSPKPFTQDEVSKRVAEDTAGMYLNQEPISGPVSVEEAIARTLKYNLDYRLKQMESALELGLTGQAGYDMLPRLLTSAGYRTRQNSPGGTSIGILDREVSLRPSTAEQQNHAQGAAEFSWNLLDFGVSYFRARQQADKFLIAEERRRKVIQNIVQDVRTSFWRALGAQRLVKETEVILDQANLALTRSREAEAQRLIPPALALNYQRALLDSISLLNLRRQDLEIAKQELAALMNVEPGVDFVLQEAEESKLPASPTDIRKLEELALLQRPELREEDSKKRITANETRKQMVSMFPAISLDYGFNYDSNNLLYHNNWFTGGIRVSWNIMRLAALPVLLKNQEGQVEVDRSRRMALSMAIMTQLRVSIERYRLALIDFKLADIGSQVDKRLAANMRASITSRLNSELEGIRTNARAVLGAYQRANAYANAQIAFGRLYNTLGFDPLPDDFEDDNLEELTVRIRDHLQETEEDTLRMTSNLFGHFPTISIIFVGVEDPIMQVRMKAQVAVLLSRHQIELDAENGFPLVLTLRSIMNEEIETTSWTLELEGHKGMNKKSAKFLTTVPSNSRDSVYESALVAAITSTLPELRSWLVELEKGDK
ncbi:MAG: TolC family protein [Nitrosomonadales bacterium]|nr:MAG: TolC family protein [Nitrosomonadales bacterium]